MNIEAWVLEHMAGVLLTIEIFWVGGVLAVFSLPLIVKWYLKKKTRQANAR